ncbi:ADP-ribosylglycohydrolase family protein [Eubacterium aggregans]|uniref:ADP-ribosylglycohydrolase family protein n=1 Tax=Eubacterium aggregans TaxID=81409 RepID=UPI003F3C388F
MLGAILGDIIGSPYEFDHNNIKTTEFPLFSEASHFTDDTIMTLAVAQGLARGYQDPEKTAQEIIAAMQDCGKRYPDGGYGARFGDWLSAPDPKPYGSFGNGAAMRVSAVAWLYNTLDEVEHYATISAGVTHDHPEGIKGAQATAAAIFLARKWTPKSEIKDYIEETYHYDLSQRCDAIRPPYHHVESCQETVPQTITAFLEGKNFESVIRLAVSLGGDSDTLAAIAGSIAEACYPIPDALADQGMARLDADLEDALYQFYAFAVAAEVEARDAKPATS